MVFYKEREAFWSYFDSTLPSTERYQQMLEHFLPQLNRHQKVSMIFQQYGTPPYWGLQVPMTPLGLRQDQDLLIKVSIRVRVNPLGYIMLYYI